MLVNDQERACIAGFDLVCVVEADDLPASDAPLADGTTRFQAPELIDPDCESSRSTASDVYAFGMLCYHVCSLPIYILHHGSSSVSTRSSQDISPSKT